MHATSLRAPLAWLPCIVPALSACGAAPGSSDASMADVPVSADARVPRRDGALDPDAHTGTDDAGARDEDASDAAARDADASAPPTRIYVTLVMHNEDTATGANPDCVALFDALEARYAANRDAVIAIADLVEARGAALSFQTDVEYLRIVAEREGEEANYLRGLAARSTRHVSLEAHAHESRFKNYADVANLLEEVTGVRNGVVGGFTATSCSPSPAVPEWEKFRAPLAPRMGGESFVATVLTDGASPGHGCDEPGSGIWLPAGHDAFFTNDPAQRLPNIGVGLRVRSLDEAVAGVAVLLEELRAGRLEEHRIYTQNVTVAQCTSDLPGRGASPAEIEAFVDAVDALDGPDDLIRWATYPELLTIWQTEYGGATSLWR